MTRRASSSTSSPTREVLLVVDNCEHVVDACAALIDQLLERCPTVTILATSREPLEVPGEQVHPVRPLGLGERSGAGVGGGAAVRRAGDARAPRVRHDPRCGGRRRGDLSSARRDPAGHRAGRRAGRAPLAPPDRRPARRPLRAPRGRPPESAAPADAPCDDRLELRPARGRRACRVPPSGGLPRLLHARSRGGGVRRASRVRRPSGSRPEVAPRDRGRRDGPPLPAARDGARLRRRATGGGR